METDSMAEHRRPRTTPADPRPPMTRFQPSPRETAAPSRIYAGVGSRSTPPDVLGRMQRIAEAMARRGWTLRSGAAAGADSAFEDGAKRAGGPREIWLPWDGFNGRTADGATRIGRNSARNRDRARRCHPAWHTLSDGAQKLMVRNVHQILGPEPGASPPADVVLCWTPSGAGGGGTGLAVRLARRHAVPVVDLGTEDRRQLRAAVDAALERGLPAEVAELLDARLRRAAPDTYRILVTGGLRSGEAAVLERRLDELAGGRSGVAVIEGTDPATGAALAWAAERGHAGIDPGPRRDDRPGPEPPSGRAARLLAAKPHVVVECGGDWSAHTQAVRDLAELHGVPIERCEGVARRPTGIEHHLAQAEAERRRGRPGAAGGREDAPAPAGPVRRGRPVRRRRTPTRGTGRPHRPRGRAPTPRNRPRDRAAGPVRDEQPHPRRTPASGRMDHPRPPREGPARHPHPRHRPHRARSGPQARTVRDDRPRTGGTVDSRLPQP